MFTRSNVQSTKCSLFFLWKEFIKKFDYPVDFVGILCLMQSLKKKNLFPSKNGVLLEKFWSTNLLYFATGSSKAGNWNDASAYVVGSRNFLLTALSLQGTFTTDSFYQKVLGKTEILLFMDKLMNCYLMLMQHSNFRNCNSGDSFAKSTWSCLLQRRYHFQVTLQKSGKINYISW